LIYAYLVFCKVGHKFGLTGLASMLAEAVTFPIDITKTRLQLQVRDLDVLACDFFKGIADF
jgi:hypothetical protein